MRGRVSVFVEPGDKIRVLFDGLAGTRHELGLSSMAEVLFYRLTDAEAVAYLRELAAGAAGLADQIEKASKP